MPNSRRRPSHEHPLPEVSNRVPRQSGADPGHRGPRPLRPLQRDVHGQTADAGAGRRRETHIHAGATRTASPSRDGNDHAGYPAATRADSGDREPTEDAVGSRGDTGPAERRIQLG